MNKTNNQIKKYHIDAEGQSLGRLASKIAILLRGKDQPDFVPYKDNGNWVCVKNIDKLVITGKKLKRKVYYHHTGFPKGFKKQTMQEIIDKKGKQEILRKAVLGMLPKNKLRAKIIKRLCVK